MDLPYLVPREGVKCWCGNNSFVALDNFDTMRCGTCWCMYFRRCAFPMAREVSKQEYEDFYKGS